MISTIRQELIGALDRLFSPIAGEEMIDLVDIEFVPMKKQALLRIIIDKKGGVSIDECQQLSHRFSYVLEVEDLISGPFRLEVTSPGLFYEFRKPADYRRNIGKRVHLWLQDTALAAREAVGTLMETDDQTVVIEDEDQKRMLFSMTSIRKIRLEPILFPNKSKSGVRKGTKWAGK